MALPKPGTLGHVPANFMPPVLQAANILYQCGLTKPDAVRIVADVWRNAPPPETQTWRQIREVNLQTLTRLDAQGLLRTSAKKYRTP